MRSLLISGFLRSHRRLTSPIPAEQLLRPAGQHPADLAIVVPFDLSAGSVQRYVEDCPVCCRPNVIDGDNVRAWAEPV